MVVSSDQSFQENNEPLFSKPIRVLASFISYVFHPLFIPLFVTYYLAFINTEFFAGHTRLARLYVMVWVFINMLFFPAMSVLLLKAVGFIDSVFLRTRKDRIIPYIAANLFYFWMFLVFHNNVNIPLIITSFVLGVFLTSSVALIINIYMKISMHGMGVGGAIGILLIILFYTKYSSGIALPMMVTIFLAGLVCSSRLVVSDHSTKEIYWGIVVGILFQYVAAVAILS